MVHNHNNKAGINRNGTTQKTAIASTAVIRPLLFAQFYSICSMHLLCGNSSNELFERCLIADTMTALNRCRVETPLKFVLTDLPDQFTFRSICYAHDLLQRIEDLFRTMGSTFPALKRRIAQAAAETATSFMLRYYTTNAMAKQQHQQPSTGWLDTHHRIIKRFVHHLYYSNTALHCLIPLDGCHLEWLSYLWAIMEFYALQFHFQFQTGIDSGNPFSNGTSELQQHKKQLIKASVIKQKQRPLVYVQRIKDYLASATKQMVNFDGEEEISPLGTVCEFDSITRNKRENAFHLLMIFHHRKL